MSTIVTNRDILAAKEIGTDGIEHLDLQVPVLSGEPQRQGDVLLLPCDSREERGTLIPEVGVTVVRGESANRNAHILHTLEGDCWWVAGPDAATDLVQGYLMVGEGSAATLIHTEEHNVLAIGPGCYEVRRQREMAGEWRLVAD